MPVCWPPRGCRKIKTENKFSLGHLSWTQKMQPIEGGRVEEGIIQEEVHVGKWERNGIS